MIGKARSIAHAASSIDYAKDRLQGHELDRQYVSGTTGKEIQREFRVVQDMNRRCGKNTISVVLSPSPEDGKVLSKEQLKDITQKYLKEMGLQGHQYIAYVHGDRAHKHIHLYVNRIDFEGRAYKDNWIGKRTQRAADLVAKEMGITRAKEVQQQKAAGLKVDRQEIRRAHASVMGRDRPKDLSGYIDRMGEKGVHVETITNSQGKLQGLKMGLEGKGLMKASDVHRSMSLNKIETALRAGLKVTKGIDIGRTDNGISL